MNGIQSTRRHQGSKQSKGGGEQWATEGDGDKLNRSKIGFQGRDSQWRKQGRCKEDNSNKE